MELRKKNLHMMQKKSEAQNQITFDEDFNVPDHKADIGQIIQKKGEVEIEQVQVSEGKAVIQGQLIFRLLYVADSTGRTVSSLEGKLPIEETLHLDKVQSGDKVCLKWEIEDLPLTYMVDGKSPLDSGDAAFDGPAFYAAMRGGAKVVTSQVTPQTYIDAMTPFLKEGKDVLFIGMSSGISGSYNSAQIAANQLREEFPACKIYTIDTLSASLGEGLLVVKAAENRRSGMSIEENAAEIDKLRHNMCQVFTVDDLKYLRGTGRLSSIKAAVASVLNIKPLLKGDTDGKIVCFEKTRGRNNAIKALAQQYDEMVREPYNQCIGIAHADCTEDAEQLIELLNRNNPPHEIMLVCYEPVTGSHVGPGTLALFFLGSDEFRSK